MVSSTKSLLSPKEAATQLGVTDKTVRNWIDAGKLAALRVGGRIRISEEAINSFIQPYEAKSQSPVSMAVAQNERDLIALREEHGLRF